MTGAEEPTVEFPDYMVSRRRTILSTDAKNEADDQYAIVHALLSPILDLRGIVPAHFGTDRGTDSMLQSRAEVDLLLDLMELTGTVPVENGAASALLDESTPQDSPGARLIVEEARSQDATLFVVAIGRYLVDQLLEFSERAPILLETHSLGDTPAIGLVINPSAAVWRAQPPTQISAELGYEPATAGATIRVAEHVDSRFMLHDLFAKVAAFAVR